MRRTISAVCIAAACSMVAVAAQATPAGQGQEKTPAGSVMVAGCLTEDPAKPGSFMLTHATAAKDATMTAGDKTAPPEKAATDTKAMAADQMASYALTGGTNLKAHLGHKVELTGTLAKTAAAGGATPPPTSRATTAPAGTLQVTALKMVARACP